MSKVILMVVTAAIGMTACVSNQYQKPSNLRFQEKSLTNNQIVLVKRDEKLCSGDTATHQKCAIDFYIDRIQVGNFYINNTAKYHLKSEVYNFKVKNCNTESCFSCDVDVDVQKLNSHNFLLSVDGEGKPFILNDGQTLQCSTKSEPTQTVVPQM